MRFFVFICALVILATVLFAMYKKGSDKSPSPSTETTESPSAETPNNIYVDAQQMWTDTGIQLSKGDTLNITASGQANACTISGDAANKWVSPDGWGYTPQFNMGDGGEPTNWIYVLGKGTSLECLTGKIGKRGKPFRVGSSFSSDVNQTGTLYLGVNHAISDWKGNIVLSLNEGGKIWPDSAGGFTAKIKILSQEKKVVIEVDARKMWTNTGLEIKRGDDIIISATGTINTNSVSEDASFKWVNANGWGYQPEFMRNGKPNQYIPILGKGSSYMCLTGKIGNGKPFKVGNSFSFVADKAGTLCLGVNESIIDPDGNEIKSDNNFYWQENVGKFSANIQHKPR
jgi:hypothetical protein